MNGPSEAELLAALHDVLDPEMPISIVDMGLVVGLQQRDVQTAAPVRWYRSPVVLGFGALLLCALLYLYIAVV